MNSKQGGFQQRTSISSTVSKTLSPWTPQSQLRPLDLNYQIYDFFSHSWSNELLTTTDHQSVHSHLATI